MTFFGLHALQGYWILAQDGYLGTVSDFLFEDTNWRVRWMVVETGQFFARRKVLIPPLAIGEPDVIAGTLSVRLTRDQILGCPDKSLDEPVSRQLEKRYLDYYGYPDYWAADGIWGYSPATTGWLPSHVSMTSPQSIGDPHLQSLKSVRGYEVEAIDARLGQVDDLIAEFPLWTLRYLAVDTRRWWPSKSVLVPTNFVDSISWHLAKFRVSLVQSVIQGAPVFHYQKLSDELGDPTRERELRDYYDRAQGLRGVA